MRETINVVSRERHGDKYWRAPGNFGHVATWHVVPVSAQEIANAARALPLGFVASDAGMTLVAVLGLEPETNPFVAPNGNWAGAYVPAALRGYPFKLVRPSDSSDNLILAVHETAETVSVDPTAGTQFFEGEAAHPKTQEMLQFLMNVESGIASARQASSVLQSANVLEPWPISMKAGETTRAVNGLFRVSEVALKALPDEQFLALRAVLPLAYAQLISMQNLSALERLSVMHAAYQQQKANEQATYFAPDVEDEKFDWKSIIGD